MAGKYPRLADVAKETSMKAEKPKQAERDHREPHRATWFATFSFLDLSGSISESQWRRFVSLLKKIWPRHRIVTHIW